MGNTRFAFILGSQSTWPWGSGPCLSPCLWESGILAPRPMKVQVLAQRNGDGAVLGPELQDLVLGVGWGEVESGLGMSQAGPEKGSFPSVACGKQERRELVFSGPVTEASATGL